MNINNTIKEVMQSKKISGYKLAKSIGINISHFYLFLRNKKSMNSNNLSKVLDFLNLELKQVKEKRNSKT